MFLHLSPTSGVPIYRQMVRQIRQRILSGELEAGTQLPSARELSAELQVNALTIAKAYQLLEQDELVETRRGLGTFVRAAGKLAPVAERRAALRTLVDELVAEARNLRLDEADVERLLADAFRRNAARDRSQADE